MGMTRSRRMAKKSATVEISKGGGPGLPASLVFPLKGNPAGLTEGGRPVECWPAYVTPESRKKLQVRLKKVSKITGTRYALGRAATSP
jgi:hypothetical protein